MKELSIEEKAKAYDKAIERARVWKEKSGMPADRQGILDDIFPELKESEDERIKRDVIETLRYGFACEESILMPGATTTLKEAIGWLENQGEDNKKGYSVWVGGFEINDYNLSKEEAEKLAEEYKKDGYDDVIVEKQGEQKPEEIGNLHDYLYGEKKPADKVEPKFKVGDWIVYNRDNYSREITQVYDIRDGRYYFTDNVHFSWSIKECDEKSHLWTIQDAKDGDVLAYPDGSIILFNYMAENLYMAHVLWVDGHIELNNSCAVSNVLPATKEQCDLLFQKMHEAGYSWDAEKKELKKIVTPIFHIGNRVRYKGHKCDGIITEITDTDYICGNAKLPISTQDKLELVEQNPAWSEEDEEMCKEVLADIIYAKNDLKAKECLGLSKRAMKAFNWFSKRYKSLRPQNTWKPSDLPRWKKSTLPNDNTTGFNSDYFHYKGYNINYKELFEKLPKDE